MNRYNSNIKIKPCKCGCGKPKKLGLEGYATLNCMPEELRVKSKYNTKNTLARANKAKLNQISRQLHKAQEDKKSASHEAVLPLNEQLGMWFVTRMQICEPKCENCGKEGGYLKLPEFKKLWKSCQAHLLPKRHFKSLQTHPLNGMVLGSGYSGLCHCHDDYDSSWEKAAKMPIWEEVVRRFLIMYPLIPQEEYQFIPPQLLQELPENQI